MMRKHINKQINIIKKTFKQYDYKKAELLANECSETIKNNGRIIASALGKNEPICQKFISTLNSLGIDSHFLNTNSAVHGDLGIIRPDDLIIILSKSSQTYETIYLIKILKKRRVNTWLLTCKKNSQLNKIVNNYLILPLESEGDLWNIIPNSSVVVFLIFLQALTLELIEKLNIPLTTFKNNHPGGGIGIKLKNYS